LIAIGSLKPNTASSEAIEVRGVNPLVTVGPKGWFQVIDQNQEHVESIPVIGESDRI
jgi:hypothetical protein